MGKLEGKVAFITGAARGQGRSHAVRLAEEGADIVALDICAQIESVSYPMATREDLQETAKQVEALGRRVVTAEADVRDVAALRSVTDQAVGELGPIDIVVANAGIVAFGTPEDDRIFADTVTNNLVGAWNTAHVVAPAMIERGAGGSIVFTSSMQGLSGRGGDGSAAVTGYAASKHGIVGVMRSLAYWLAPHRIRVNSVHPTGVDTPMLANEVIGTWFAQNPAVAAMAANHMPVEMVESADISNAVLYLVSDDGRYVTGATLPVDAGAGIS
ncbi:mycofactocin-coupled SDR family oxidoreductase [Amycolatopsis sp. Poz14]|uniref:mycofactocin-coupled SDR family oxidoreductase n=1 Tax=Amycolatopsis sp. Poz14 TaxID=1447705 RepID=UPI001EE8A654|nr:mycofactocin-coupled SDR family oxidoreductase [Amycolatopsis sp. Poz14]MCG3754000.1 mycofactocin-coupled SDR family oxidoreductase [Amycolatopsis sp. Poz14]